ncbi:MAG: GlxA family transcriptional regulator [Amphritea sp.]
MLKNIDHTYKFKTVLPESVRQPRLKGKRNFSNLMRVTNSAFLPSTEVSEKTFRVGFLLLEHCSMMAFTAAVDALMTANLVGMAPLFSFTTYGISSAKVKSDLGIEISTQGSLDSLNQDNQDSLDVLIVCGGFRCSVAENKQLTKMLKTAARQQTIMGGIWNGAIPLAYAGLLDDMQCALHPDNHAFMNERFDRVIVSNGTQIIEDNRITCAGHASALEMMLKLIEQFQGKDIVRAICEILNCDRVVESGESNFIQSSDDPYLPDTLKEVLRLMNLNIEEPLCIEALALCVGISRRHIERLFKKYLETSPARYYLEVRITHARRLVLQSNASITDISVASGFVTTSHFSNCYKDFFGVSPTLARDKHRF